MKLQIHSIDIINELIKIKVLQDCSLDHYLICDTTYTSDIKISNELRHTFWLPTKKVFAGDWVFVYSKNGTDTTWVNNLNTTTHAFYWNLSSKVWNNTGDAAVLFEINTWKTTKAL